MDRWLDDRPLGQSLILSQSTPQSTRLAVGFLKYIGPPDSNAPVPALFGTSFARPEGPQKFSLGHCTGNSGRTK
jgi:hypothetical protein